MDLNYDAEHVLRFDLDEPFHYNNREVDLLRIEIMWVDAEGDQPDGWWVTTEFYGWPLTTKGARDKRAKTRERAYPLPAWPLPYATKAVVWAAWYAAMERTGIDQALIVNPGEGLLSEKVWEPAPENVTGGKCSDCGIEVLYADEDFWPWHGVDGSTLCPSHTDQPFGHRLDRTVADAIFATHERLTGAKARRF